MKLHTAILLLLMWLVIGIEPGAASPLNAINVQSVCELGHRHQAFHAIARTAAWLTVPGLLIAAALIATMQRRIIARARQGNCLRDAAPRTRANKTTAVALLVIPPVVFTTLSWILDGSINWQCSLGPQIDFAADRAQQLAAVVAAAALAYLLRRLIAKTPRSPAMPTMHDSRM